MSEKHSTRPTREFPLPLTCTDGRQPSMCNHKALLIQQQGALRRTRGAPAHRDCRRHSSAHRQARPAPSSARVWRRWYNAVPLERRWVTLRRGRGRGGQRTLCIVAVAGGDAVKAVPARTVSSLVNWRGAPAHAHAQPLLQVPVDQRGPDLPLTYEADPVLSTKHNPPSGTGSAVSVARTGEAVGTPLAETSG
jgi:hypothetical protein